MGPEEDGQCLRISLGESQVGHQNTLFDALRVPNPAGQVRVGVLESTGGDVGSSANVGQIGTNHPLGSINGLKRVAGNAALAGKELLTGSILCIPGATLLSLLLEPG